MGIEMLVGKTFEAVEGMQKGSRRVEFVGSYRTYTMEHDQECCEEVSLQDVCGDVEDLVGTPIVRASERTEKGNLDGCVMWTFYRIETIKGTVVLIWLGESNGYYGVEVGVREVVCG